MWCGAGTGSWSSRPWRSRSVLRGESATTYASSKLNRVGRRAARYDSGLSAHRCTRPARKRPAPHRIAHERIACSRSRCGNFTLPCKFFLLPPVNSRQHPGYLPLATPAPPLPHNHARYNSRSQLTGKTYSNGQGAVTLQYDQGGAGAFALGRLTSITDPSGSESFTFDPVGRITQIQKGIGTTTFPIQYQYNPGGQVTRITYPSNSVVNQNVDNFGLLNTIVSGTTSYASIPDPPTGYNAAGQILTFTYGNG